jgi:hypothetical protein
MIENRRAIVECLLRVPEAGPAPGPFASEYEAARAKGSHIEAIQGLTAEAAGSAASWLGGIAAQYRTEMGRILNGS